MTQPTPLFAPTPVWARPLFGITEFGWFIMLANRPVASHDLPRREDVLAALDLGTNNCRLLIARPQGDGFRVIDSFSRIVRLGERVTHAGALHDEAMERTIDALRICANKMQQRGVTLSRQVATEACRRADNGAAFLARVEDRTGLRLEVISNEEEARLALDGCRPLLDPDIPDAIVFDIGGGSTELAWMRASPGDRPTEDQTPGDQTPGEGGRVEVTSMPVGVVSLSEKYGGDRFAPETYRRMVGECAAQLDAFDSAHNIGAHVQAGTVQMLGTSGTVTTLAGVHLKLERYMRDRVDGVFLKFADIRRLAGELAGMDFAGRSELACIGPARADLVVAGCAILEAICEKWPLGHLRVADRGVREGILRGLLERL